MKNFCLVVLFVMAALGSATAQVTVEILMDQDQFLPSESMPIGVRIVNRSGQTLRLGADSSWLTLAVESRDGSGASVSRLGDVPVVGEFELENAKMATKRLDLAPHFLLSRSGRYAVTATVRIPGWAREIVSQPKVFMMIEGTRLWETEFGVPNSAVSTGEPETRKYVLQQANYLRGQLRLYMRLTDATGLKTIKVVAVGPMISFGRPEPQVDKFSNLHVLYQHGPRGYSYHVFNCDGETVIRQAYDIGETRPRLKVTHEGEVVLVGGVRKPTASDLPPAPPDLPVTSDGTNATPALATNAPAVGDGDNLTRTNERPRTQP